MGRPTVHTVVVAGETLSLPLTFATLRAMKVAGVLPSAVIRSTALVDEVDAVVTLVAVSQICGKPVTEDQVRESAIMGDLRRAASDVHTALVMMFGPEKTPDPKEVPPPPAQ